MAAILELEHGPVVAPETEGPAIRKLEAALAHVPNKEKVKARLIGPKGESLELPASVYTLLRRVVHDLAQRLWCRDHAH